MSNFPLRKGPSGPRASTLAAASINVSAGTTSLNLTNLVFSDSHGVSFGLNASTITASIALGAISAGTTLGTLGTIVFSNSNGITFGMDGGTVTASVMATAAAGSVNFSAGTTSQNLQSITFSNSNGISFGLNGSTMTASVATSLTNINLSAGTTSQNLSNFVLSNSNGVSFGLAGSTITASVGSSQGSINFSAGTTSQNLSAITFSNANGVSFGLAGSTMTASVSLSTAPGAIAAGTQTATSGTVLFADSNGITFGMSGSSRVTAAFGGFPVKVFSQDADFVTNFSILDGVLSIQKLSLPMSVSASQLIAALILSGFSGSSGALTISHGVYTMTGGTANLASSGSRLLSWASGSATSASSQYGGASGTRYRTVGIGYSLTPGDYLFAWWMRTTGSATWLAVGRAGIGLVGNYDGVETSAFLNGVSGSSFTTAMPASIAASDTGYVRTGASAMRQPGGILMGF